MNKLTEEQKEKVLINLLRSSKDFGLPEKSKYFSQLHNRIMAKIPVRPVQKKYIRVEWYLGVAAAAVLVLTVTLFEARKESRIEKTDDSFVETALKDPHSLSETIVMQGASEAWMEESIEARLKNAGTKEYTELVALLKED